MTKFKVSTKEKKQFVYHQIFGLGYVYSVRRNMFDNEYIYTVIFPGMFGDTINIQECKESELDRHEEK